MSYYLCPIKWFVPKKRSVSFYNMHALECFEYIWINFLSKHLIFWSKLKYSMIPLTVVELLIIIRKNKFTKYIFASLSNTAPLSFKVSQSLYQEGHRTTSKIRCYLPLIQRTSAPPHPKPGYTCDGRSLLFHINHDVLWVRVV